MDLGDRDDDELRDPVPDVELDLLGRVEVHDRADHLAAVARIDQARRVREGEPTPGREPAPREHEARVALRDRDGDSGRDHRALPRRDHRVGGGPQVKAGVPGVLRGGELGLGAEPAEPHLHGQGSSGSISSSRLPNGSRTWQRW
jgi:hypothetical protein